MINPISKAYDYVSGVESGAIIVCEYVKMAVARFQKDLITADERGIHFDESAAQKALDFFELLCFTKGKWKGKPFSLEPWQAFIIANIFGWINLEDGFRRFTEVYLRVSKKNGKTELLAGIGLYLLVLDDENTPEVYAAAYTKEQAGICFKAAKSMARQSEHIRDELDIFTGSLYCDFNEGIMRPLSHDANNTEGNHSSGVLFDEYHTHKTDDVKTSLRSGMAAREQPLFVTITTAGSNKQGPCFSFEIDCIEVLKGTYERENLFAIIYGLDEGDNWTDPEMWKKANPNYGVSVRPRFLELEFKKAEKNGREEVEFKTKHLNMWADAHETWIPSEVWNANSVEDPNIPGGSQFYAGLDLGFARDIASFSMYFPDKKLLLVRHYCSTAAAQYAVGSGFDYMKWEKGGHLITTPGETTNYDRIFNDIVEFASKYELMFLGYDPYSAQMFKQKLETALGETYVATRREDGTLDFSYHKKVQVFSQNPGSISPPTRMFEEMVLNGELKHDGNPITGWMLGNVHIETDMYNNIKPVKKKSSNKIDGIVSAIMALGVFSKWHLTTDTYAKDGSYGIY